MKFELILKTSFEIEPTSDDVEDIQTQAKFEAEKISRELGSKFHVFGIVNEEKSINFIKIDE